MEEAEKMAALKKAYADIILNTAKEAAARIMVSERKAFCFQKDLFCAKEESLSMLIRLKQMMDSKATEAQVMSLNQQRRIDELEAQLNEAEDIVRDLREELKVVQDDLEMLKNNQVKREQIVKGDAASQEDTLQEDKLHTSEFIIFPPDWGSAPITTSDMKNTPLNQRNTDNTCCNATTQTEPSSNSRTESYYAGNPDLASIIMRSKEPELYRNGCTQRIRAFERNLLDGKLPLSGQRDDQHSHIMIESIIREDEKGEGTCTVASPKADNMGVMEKNPIGLEEVMQDNSSYVKGQGVKFIHKRRRIPRNRNTKASSCRSLPDQVMKACQSSVLSSSKNGPYSVNMNIESGEEPSKLTENEAQKDPESHLAPGLPSNTTDLDPLSGCEDGTESDVEVIKAGSVQNSTNKDIALMDKSVLTRQESEVAKSSGVPVCKLNLETVDVPFMNSDLKNSKTSETTNGTPTQTGFLKYTFRRKRKKESMSSPDENTSLEKKILKRTGENQNGAPEPQKPSLILESSRDSRRLVQVARQLISLSEKRWW